MITALCVRTQMIGGGTGYEVLFRTSDKPSRPLYPSGIYEPVIHYDGVDYYGASGATIRRELWSAPAEWGKWEKIKRHNRVAARLACRIAKRVFPELRGRRELPATWACWTLPSERREVSVMMDGLPE